ncbi:hypothetical protein EVG20_g11308 [Dentipellis fragilis]|uniref:Uncharacterized protein n=1 Tax=Dentipellis fragilis TaxID=205917 RepID=A0A4Y9XM57_9AGAM|nr:hypothetical protein EVG20_g11308 [Dentipellis fragilis]
MDESSRKARFQDREFLVMQAFSWFIFLIAQMTLVPHGVWNTPASRPPLSRFSLYALPAGPPRRPTPSSSIRGCSVML